MPRLFTLLILPLTLLAADRAPTPLPAEQAAKEMKLPEGFRSTLFAAEPDVVQPISFTIDHRGRLWVAEALNYGEWKATGKDRIVILEDTEGDGRADKRTVFYEGFNYITAIEVGFGGVWVMSPPCLYFVPDRDGDDKPDGPPEVVFDGFGYKESRHNLANGFTWGPDGWLYGGHGRTSPSDVGKPGTPADKRVHCDGGVYRIHPTKRIFENFADGTTNPWGVDFDDYGACFVSNCVNPHLFHMIQGGHYEPWRNRPSSLYAYERLPTIADHLHYAGADLKAAVGMEDTLALGGGHAHCGTLVYLGGSFPTEYRNTVMMCNIHGHRINRDILKRVGSGYVASHGKDFMLAADPWFMGVTLRTGPDGSVFVSDWSDTGECHTYKPDSTTGRIFQLSYGKPDRTRIDLSTKTDEELVALQTSRNEWKVRTARRLLQERATSETWDDRDVLIKLAAIRDSKTLAEPQRLRAMWTTHVLGGFNLDRLKGSSLLLNLVDPSEHVRAWAVRFLCEDGDPGNEPGNTARSMLKDVADSDQSAVVRLSLASALQRLPVEHRWGIAESLLNHAEDAKDANLPLMIWYGVEPLVPADPARAMRLASKAKIPVVRRYIARRFVDDALSRKDKGDLRPWVTVLGSASDDVRKDLLDGARDSMRGRKTYPMPSNWPSISETLTHSTDPRIREAATALALTFGDPAALVDLRKRVESQSESVAARTAAVEALVEHRAAGFAPILHQLLNEPAMRKTALRGLAAYDDPATPKLVIALYPKLAADEKPDAIATLAGRADYALALLDAVDTKVVARTDVSAYAARQMYALKDWRVTGRLVAVWGEVRETPADKQKQFAKYKAQLTPNALKAADLKNGRLVFSKTCQSCHKLYGEGTAIGPDLTGSNRSDLDYLLSNVIDPSAEVGRDYRMSVINTQSGRVITGIVVERSPARLVVQTATEKVIVPAEDVDSVKDSAVSLMPDGQLDALTKEQVRDLMAYLMAKQQVPLPKGNK
ncbi:MAG TPA: PVC-type heme-binding CxxCH protein [Gemmataceae bacterium]|jgi:putative membrane-bound dehydrogenase-like protein|nr:PVC-type heme-binding CxxCH protein [Gemmataceae bacterium]